MVATMQEHWTDTHGQRVMSGERYAAGRGSRVKATSQMTVYQDAESGDWHGSPRGGGAQVRLGVPGEQDAQGESAKLAFIPLGDDWEELPISSSERESGERRTDFEEILRCARNARHVLSNCYDDLLALSCDKLCEAECDQLHGKIYNDAFTDDAIFEIVDRPFINA